MSKATGVDGSLQPLAKCFIVTPYGTIRPKILPDISDSKSASYANETIIGRSSPVPTYSYSEPRTISTDLTFMITKTDDIAENLQALRIIESLVYPGEAAGGAPYTPPPVSKIYCGRLLSDYGLCVVLKSYSVKFPPDVAWDVETYLPYKFNISCQWEVVYACPDLPTYQKIRTLKKNWPSQPRYIDE